MIIVDVFEYVGKNVRVYLENGETKDGLLEYIPAYSEIYNFKRPKHFYINDYAFRSYHIKRIEKVE